MLGTIALNRCLSEKSLFLPYSLESVFAWEAVGLSVLGRDPSHRQLTAFGDVSCPSQEGGVALPALAVGLSLFLVFSRCAMVLPVRFTYLVLSRCAMVLPVHLSVLLRVGAIS